jgi:hypothetical protein
MEEFLAWRYFFNLIFCAKWLVRSGATATCGSIATAVAFYVLFAPSGISGAKW